MSLPRRLVEARPTTDHPAPDLPRLVAGRRAVLMGRLMAIGVGEAAGAIAAALLVRRLFHLPSGSRDQLAAVALGLTLAVGVVAVLRGVERVAAERLGQHYVTQVRAELFAHLTQVPARVLGRRRRGSMLLRFVGDLSALRTWVSLGLAKLVVAGTAVLLATTALVVLDARMGAAALGVLALGAIAVAASGPWLATTNRTARNRRARLTGEVVERLTHVGVVQASGQQQRERRRVARVSSSVADAMVARAVAGGVCRALAEGTSGLATAAVVVVGVGEIRSGRSSTGTVVAAVTVVGLLAGHLRDLGRVAEYAAAAAVARAAARRFLALPTLTDVAGRPALAAGFGAVEFEGVCVAGALHGVTLRAEPGQTIAVVGANGAGKSTLVSLAARLMDPDAGRVRIDGHDLRDVSLASVRVAVGLAGPDLPLLRGSVERNVLYRRPRAGDAEIERIRSLCRLDELVADLPGGWDADVGDGGQLLSAGQRARLELARAALGEPALLVLDEADAHLDAATAVVVERVLDDHRGTALVVTHQRRLVEHADLVWCLEGGRVVETGPPELLLIRDGPTARLLGGIERLMPSSGPAGA